MKLLVPTKSATNGLAGRSVNVARAADLLDTPFVHDRDLVGQGERLALIVRHVDGGDLQLALQTLQLEAHLLAELGVQVRQRLIEQQERRLHRQRARERQALLLAAGERRRLAVGQLVELHGREHPHYVVANLPARVTVATDLQWKGGILEHVHVWPDGVGLEHHAEAALVGRHEDACGRRIDDPIVDRDPADARPLETGNRAKRRRLTAAARTKQREETPLGHGEAHVLRRPDGAPGVRVFGAQALDCQHFSPAPELPRVSNVSLTPGTEALIDLLLGFRTSCRAIARSTPAGRA